MRRGKRLIREKRSSNFKYLLYLSSGLLLIIVLTFIITFVVYNNKLKNSAYKSLGVEKIADLVPNVINEEETESATAEIGKTIDEIIKEAEKNVEEKINEEKNISNNEETEVKQTAMQEKPIEEVVPIVKDPEFIYPTEGDISREFAKDNLIFSNTLEEWVTHFGVDIKAERTAIVKSAEEGTVVAIKNDPRYGLTIVIEHINGYKSVYSNLLTSEFVKEGEKVEKGQAIGTVGNSASFEVADEPHLHFEILKDNENVDPRIYIK